MVLGVCFVCLELSFVARSKVRRGPFYPIASQKKAQTTVVCVGAKYVADKQPQHRRCSGSLVCLLAKLVWDQRAKIQR